MANFDIAELILDEHAKFRRALDEIQKLTDSEDVRSRWADLNAQLEVHASAEEEIFYPALLRDVDDSEGETEHAIKDHNEIRETTSKVNEHPVGTDAWWAALSEARDATLEHLEEEEQDVLTPFRSEVDEEKRTALGRRWLEFVNVHEGAEGLTGDEKDPQEYVEEHSA